ncbi:transglycosylase SLT domain-containing protein [Streptomyces sp. NPDC017936]|uniref:transglycosylase SLT domain-containing protein n=1 Tax=Streptomyces sp. NPDC017936 TaxID=3365016 RepID=UPI0037AAFDB4
MAAADLDIVGGAAVDVVPIAPQFHTKLKGIVLPAADRVGEEAGRRLGEAMSRHIVVAIPNAITNGGRAARTSATRQGDDNAGAFARAFKTRLEAAFRSLPRPDVRLSTTGFDADLARVRARMESLANKRVGVDIDAATAFAQISAIDAELERLGAQTADIQVRSDIAAARAGLAEMERAVNDLDGETATVRVRADTGQARTELMQLGVLLGVVAAIPVIPVAAAGLGAIASAAVAAGAGVGALALAAVPAIKGVTSAIQAKTAAEQEASRATDNGAASSVKAAQSALQLASAQSALRNAHRQAAQGVADASRQVADAERALVDAKRAARDAEDDLTQARRDARQELRSLQDQLLDGALVEREATLRTKEAREELARVMADPKSTDLQRQRAQLSVDEAVRNADRQRAKQAELKRSVEEATKAGVDGNEAVKDATKRVADAQRAVQDRTRAVADAQAKVRTAEVQGAEAVANAERSLQAARLSSIDTTAKAVTKADEYQKALAKLTPEQRDLYDSIAGPTGLKAAFSAWAKALSPDVLPLFTRAVNGAKNALPGLSPLVRETAAGVEELQDAASKELKEPFWQGFKRDIEGSARPAVVGLGKAFGNTLKGMAGVVDAFLPHMDDIAARMVRTTGRFANWGTGLKGSPEFERFLDYAAKTGPKVAAFFGAIVGAALSIGSALSPLSGPLLEGLTLVVDGIATVAEHAPFVVQGIWLAVAAWKAWTVVVWLWNAAMAASGIPLIVAGIAALAAGVVYAYQKFPAFRDAVQTAWSAIKTATDWLWTQALKPFFEWFGGVVVWIWDTIVKPYIGFIVAYWKLVGDVFVWLWSNIVKPYIDFMVAYWLMVADVISWLWSGIFSPIFGFIGDLIAWWWKNIVERYFGYVMTIVRGVGDIFVWLYDLAIKPVFDEIADKADWLWTKGLKPAFDLVKQGVGLVGDAFGDAKDAISENWREVAGIVAKPVNFIIDWVYNKGIKAVFDGVSKYVGMDPLPKAPKLLDTNPKFFADGGRTSGGTPGVDSIPALLMADEFVIKRSSARKIGFDKLAYMNERGELPRFADGGIVGALGDAWDFTKDAASNVAGKAVDWAQTAADLVANPSKIWSKLTKPILDKVKEKLSGSPMLEALAKLPAKMISGIKDKIIDTVSFSGGGGGGGNANVGGGNGGSGVARWRPTVLQALSMTGNPAAYADLTLRRMNQESGGNPTIVNKWDSNWLAGHPSVGLMQVIGPTFRAHAGTMRDVGPFSYGVSTNPLANIYASMRYAMSAYGSLPAAYNRPGGYALGGRVVPTWFDDGGYLPKGLSLVANGTGSPEPVFTSSQFADIRAAKSAGPTTPPVIHNHVYLGTREITDIVDERVEVYDHDTATALNNGRLI